MPGESNGDLVLCVVFVARPGGADSQIRILYLSRVGERNVRLTPEWAAQPAADIVRIIGLRILAHTRIAQSPVSRISKIDISLPGSGDSPA